MGDTVLVYSVNRTAVTKVNFFRQTLNKLNEVKINILINQNTFIKFSKQLVKLKNNFSYYVYKCFLFKYAL